MYYEEYEWAVQAYKRSDETYQQILAEKESLFQMTQPKSTRLDQDRVSNSDVSTGFDTYLIEKERRRIDERLEEALGIVQARAEVVSKKYELLYESNNLYDVVYRLRFLESVKVLDIAHKINYSEAQVYRFLKTIKENICNEMKEEQW